MLVTRLYGLGCWLITGVVFYAWAFYGPDPSPVMAWMIMSGSVLMILTVLALGERDTWTTRVRKRIPRSTLLRCLAFLLYTGSAGGILWWTLMFAATILVGWISDLVVPRVCAMGLLSLVQFVDICRTMALTFAYVLCYCLTVASLRSSFLRRVPTVFLPVIASLLAVALWLVPCLVAFLGSRLWWDELPWYLVGSPLVLSMSEKVAASEAAVHFVLPWLGLCLLFSTPWFVGQWRRFVPMEKSLVPKEETPEANLTPLGT